jgi:hypothetical protein
MSEPDAEAIERPEFGYLQSDEPITRRAEDRFDRARLADAIADQVIHGPPGQGFVIAIDGAWGSGKTSVLNMIEEVVTADTSCLLVAYRCGECRRLERPLASGAPPDISPRICAESAGRASGGAALESEPGRAHEHL